jgi:hypothetical protein
MLELLQTKGGQASREMLDANAIKGTARRDEHYRRWRNNLW